jgi:predicted RNA methylase
MRAVVVEDAMVAHRAIMKLSKTGERDVWVRAAALAFSPTIAREKHFALPRTCDSHRKRIPSNGF